MFGSDYAQFLEPSPDYSSFVPQNNIPNRIENPHYLINPVIEAEHDRVVFSEFTNRIQKWLSRQPYPANFRETNPFCPLCLKFVENKDNFFNCNIQDDRNYLIHNSCLQKESGYKVKEVGQILKNSAEVRDSSDSSTHKHHKVLSLSDNRQFFLQISFSHPINDKSFFKTSKKTTISCNQFWIGFNERE